MGINPVNDKQIPIFISDYVLSTYEPSTQRRTIIWAMSMR